jgi:hypothetical protein
LDLPVYVGLRFESPVRELVSPQKELYQAMQLTADSFAVSVRDNFDAVRVASSLTAAADLVSH